MATLLGAQVARADKPSFHHHHEGEDGEEQDHYKDSSEKPPKAQVGLTLFTSRALLGKNGVTDLEVTTGTLDSKATPPGYLSEVQVKAFRPDGRRQFEKEFEHLRSGGGYAKFSFPLPAPARRHDDDDDGSKEEGSRNEGSKKDTRLEHGQILKLHVEGKGLLSGDDGEAEARLTNTVKYRPDLALSSLHYPAVARAKTSVDISASVVELMGDTAAHADCVLSVDGSAVDIVPGIWVDANGTVSCHFATTFAVAGQHTLTVSLQNVVPADYDGDNDSLSGMIRIESPSVLAYFSSVSDLIKTTSLVRDVFPQSDPTRLVQHNVSDVTQRTQTRMLSGTIPAAVNLPLKKASFADQTDGHPVSTVNLTDLAADTTVSVADPTYDTVSTIARLDSQTGGWFKLDRYSNSTTGAGVTNVSWNFFGGDVTFHSAGYCKGIAGVFACVGGDWTMNPTTGGSTFGAPPAPLGAKYAADVVVDDGTAYQAHPAMDLLTKQSAAPARTNCQNTTVNGTPSRVCMQSSATSSMTSGSASFTPPSM